MAALNVALNDVRLVAVSDPHGTEWPSEWHSAADCMHPIRVALSGTCLSLAEMREAIQSEWHSAARAWPWPRAIDEKGIPFASPSCESWLVGSTPGESTKINGRSGCESAKTELRSRTGGSVYFWPRLLMMNAVVAKMIRSGRRQRTMMVRWSSEHRFSHSPGSRAAAVSGSGWRYLKRGAISGHQRQSVTVAAALGGQSEDNQRSSEALTTRATRERTTQTSRGCCGNRAACRAR